MKALLILWLVVLPTMTQADSRVRNVGGFLRIPPKQSPASPSGPSELELKLRAEAERRNFVPKDPWRLIDGQKTFAKGDDWLQFHGKVLQVANNGIRIQGAYGPPLRTAKRDTDFFVANFPYVCADDEVLSRLSKLVAKESGVYTYVTVQGASRTIRKLDYGIICEPPELPQPTQEQLKAAEELKEKKQQEAKLKAQKWHEELAEKGDAYGQLRMGERYLTGDGVEKDETKARMFLQASANQGNAEAAKLLQTLKPISPLPSQSSNNPTSKP